MVKKVKTKIGKGGKTERGLNPQQEAFCQCYVNGDRELMGNGVQSYILVYQPDETEKNWYKTACQSASQILSNIKVIGRINELLQEGGLNDSNVDKQLSFLLNQHADFGNKLGAIREYNRLRQRVIDKGGDTNITIVDVGGMTEEERIVYLKSKISGSVKKK